MAVGLAGGKARRSVESEFSGHLRQRRNGVEIARGAQLRCRYHQFRLPHAVAVVDLDLAAAELYLFVLLPANA